MWIIYGLLAALTAALMTVVAKLGLQGVDGTLATAIRSGFMFVFILITTASLGKFKDIGTLSTKHLGWIALAAVFGALSWLFYFLGLKLTSAPKLASLDRLSLPLIILITLFFFHEPFSWKLVTGGALVTIGAILVALA